MFESLAKTSWRGFVLGGEKVCWEHEEKEVRVRIQGEGITGLTQEETQRDGFLLWNPSNF